MKRKKPPSGDGGLKDSIYSKLLDSREEIIYLKGRIPFILDIAVADI